MRNNALFARLILALIPIAAHATATITIINGDPSGKGFNDNSAADPVGGNNGTTIGQQRLNAFQAAADKWGATLTSAVPIRVLATWDALGCTANSATLGGASATEAFLNFKGAPKTGTLYSKALANAISGVDQDPRVSDIRARFNINLGNAGCLTGTHFYLGLDNNHGTDVDLVTVLTHEFGHGLGFQTFTDASSGAQFGGYPSIWDYFLLDTSVGMTWDQMTDDQRAASSLRNGKLVWNGSNVNSSAINQLWWGTPSLQVTQPDSVAGSYSVGSASFGPPLANPGISAEIATFVDTDPGQALACNPLSDANTAAIVGKIALVDRGTCTFVIKAANVQAAGALGMIVVDNVAGSPPPNLGGLDSTILIPSVRVTQSDGAALKAALGSGSVIATLGVNPNQVQGADPNGNVLMYAPSPYQGGSSVSHFDISAFPNLLMEPNISDDLTHEVTPPQDLTYLLLKDIGWQ